MTLDRLATPVDLDLWEARPSGGPLVRVDHRPEQRSGFCALGSLKPNLGHLDAASGVAALIKTVLALEHGSLPPSLHFERPNPEIDFESSPFYVNTQLADWKPEGLPRLKRSGGRGSHVRVVPGAPFVFSIRSMCCVDRGFAAGRRSER